MSDFDTKCRICGHYDHFFITPYDGELFKKPMCWNGRRWIYDCKCRKHIESNLEFLEWKYEQRHVDKEF